MVLSFWIGIVGIISTIPALASAWPNETYRFEPFGGFPCWSLFVIVYPGCAAGAHCRNGCGSKPMGSGWCTHFSLFLWLDWDVHWGYDLDCDPWPNVFAHRLPLDRLCALPNTTCPEAPILSEGLDNISRATFHFHSFQG